MKRFIKKIFYYLIGLILLLLTNVTYNTIKSNSAELKMKKSSVLIIGDSHPLKAIDPNLFINANNICQGAENYIISYWKLKKILSLYTPDTIIIGFSNHNISEFNDIKFYKKKYAATMFKRVFLIHDFKGLKKLNNTFKINKKEYYMFILKYFCLYPKFNHIHFIGTYENSKISEITNAEERANRHFYNDDTDLSYDFSKTNISYLDSIILTCKINNIIPILVQAPVHKSYYNLIPEKNKNKYEFLKEKYSNYLINFDQRNYHDSLFYDSDHLNEYGAKLFTKQLINTMKKNK